jgi:hypothetical protein
MGGDRMHYEAILMNPPYSVGNKVTSTAIETCCKCVCLMPLGQYKSNNLYRHVESMDLADPEMFEDADITNNLCICTLRKDVVDKFKTYEEMAMESYDPKFKKFYEKNNIVHKFFVEKVDVAKRFNTKEDALSNVGVEPDLAFYLYIRVPVCGVPTGTNSYDYKYNHNELPNSSLPTSLCDGGKHYKLEGRFAIFKNAIGKSNLTTWWYSNGKDGLSHKLMVGLNKAGGNPFDAIPRIDWEAISGTQLWKEGKYDEAVLDVMGLKWNDEKDGVVRRTTK